MTFGTRTKVRISTPAALLEFLQMAALKNLCGVVALASAAMFAGAQASAPAVRRVAVVGQNPLRLQIQTSSAAATPVAQMISGPDRLVIDIPNHIPAASLRGIAVNQGEVKGVRVSLFSSSPPVTRIVVDLNAPLQYRIVPNPSGLLVSLGNDPENSPASSTTVPTAATIGWVSPKASVKLTNVPVGSVLRKSSAHPAIGANSVSVEFANGLLSIHATGATLSEVLFQIQKKTGAEIAIPSGTEQDRVAADFGPGPAGEVLGELLNGSGLNFVVVGSESDPTALRSVILSRASQAVFAPASVPQAYTPTAAENVPPESEDTITPTDANATVPGNAAPQQPGQPPADSTGPVPPPD